MNFDVLLVEHDLGFALKVEQVLEPLGAVATLHTTSEEMEATSYLSAALERGVQPQLILLDWDLPKQQSEVVLERMREVPGAGAIPVLVFSQGGANGERGWGRLLDEAHRASDAGRLSEFVASFLAMVEKTEANRADAHSSEAQSSAAKASPRRAARSPSAPMLADLIQNVRRTARKVCRSLPETIRADAESAAMVGLVEALRHFGQLEENHFDNYLKLRVRGAIRDEARRFDPLPRRMRELIGRIEKVAATHRKEHGVDPDMDVVANAIGVDEDRCWQAVELAEFNTLPIDDDTLSAPPHTAEDQFVESYAAAALRWALAKLSKRSRLVLRLWYRRGLTVSAIADRLKVSVSRVHQLRVEAERQLGKYLKNAPPMSDLGETAKRFDWDDHTDESRSPAVALRGREGRKVGGSEVIRNAVASGEKFSG